MVLPQQIQEQTEAIDELYKALGKTPRTDDVDVVEDNVEDNVDDKVDDKVVEDFSSEVEPETVVAEANEEIPESESNEDKDKGESEDFTEGWKHKYSTLQGIHNADTGRYKDQIDKLETLIASMTAAVDESESTTPEPLITSEDREEWGDAAIDVMRKAAREEVTESAKRVTKVENQLKHMQSIVPQMQKVAQQQSKVSEQTFVAELDREVPDWREVNDDPNFHKWLLEIEPFTGFTYQAALTEAGDDRDVSRVIHFFKTFKNGNTDVKDRRGVQSELEKQLPPGKKRSSSKVSTEKTVYSRDDITKFYSDVIKGVYKGSDDKRKRIEADIFAAQNQGRIRV